MSAQVVPASVPRSINDLDHHVINVRSLLMTSSSRNAQQSLHSLTCAERNDFMPEATDNYSPDSTKVFSEKLNGRAAMLGLAIGLATEALTGKGIIDQVFGIFG